MRNIVSREEARDMEQAHYEGFHDNLPRQFCPACEGKLLNEYPTAQQIRDRRVASVDG